MGIILISLIGQGVSVPDGTIYINPITLRQVCSVSIYIIPMTLGLSAHGTIYINPMYTETPVSPMSWELYKSHVIEAHCLDVIGII